MKESKLDTWNYVINPGGTTATVNLNYHDEGDYGNSWDVYLTFSDPALNPPGYERWMAGNVGDWRSTTGEVIQQATTAGTELYDWIMNLRMRYGLEETVNHWRRRYEEEHGEALAKQRLVQDLTDKLNWKEERIKELETDYVKKLENKLESYRKVIKLAHERALEYAKLLSIKETDTQ